MKKFALALLAGVLTLGVTGCGAIDASKNVAENSSIINVNSKYRVVSVEPGMYQFGVALLDANPYHIQNYVHIRIDTKISQRVYTNGGAYDRMLSPTQIFNVVQPGTIIHVKGGRDWDNTIVAKKIWF